jgi:dGTPase
MELFCTVVDNNPSDAQRLNRISGRKEKIEFLRAKVINQAIGQCRDCFLDNEEDILAGKFDSPLMSHIPKRREMDELINVARQKLYCAPEVVEIETAGFEVISELLERFIQVLDDVAEHGDAANARSNMMIHLIPTQFIGPEKQPSHDNYQRLLRLTDFVSGMTDSYAVSLYKKVTGISLPGR